MSTEVKPREVTAVKRRRYLENIVKQDGTLLQIVTDALKIKSKLMQGGMIVVVYGNHSLICYRKEVVNLEEKTRKEWRSKWGFIADYQQLIEEELLKQGLKHSFLTRKQAEVAHDHFKMSLSPPFPRTSAGMVGWRSSDPQNSLEIAGPMYVSPVLTIHPPELGAPPNQLTIFVN